TPRVIVMKGHTVPRQYVKSVQQYLQFFLSNVRIGNEEIELTYFDFIIYGMTFLMYMQNQGNQKDYSEQAPYYKIIHQRANEYDERTTDHLLIKLWLFVQYLMTGYSKLNYRLYGFTWDWKELENRSMFAGIFMLTSVPYQNTYFKYYNKIRPAFKVGYGQFIGEDPTFIKIPYNKLITESNDTTELDVYIQSHALSRMKERLGILTPSQRNVYLNYSIKECKICTLSNGQLVINFLAESNFLGYLPFTIVDKKVFILTFLPKCHIKSPQGRKLAELLDITREEMEYFGMDKLNFFHDTDFEAIPRLKNAIIEADLWHLTEIDIDLEYKPVSTLSTNTLARYFEGEKSHHDVLNELE
ncbi:MAG TPA: hypothetical protein P5084_15030, partial [Paludibacter sp.]|nr:hypothetical protein [Paludibacter sp.]